MTPDTEAAHALHLEGDACNAAGRHAQALDAFLAAEALAPDNPIYPFNAAVALRLLGRTQEALAAYDRAIAIAPGFAVAQHNRATLLLQLGDLRAGFQAFEWRKSCPGFEDPRYGLPRQWAGQSIEGQRLFIYPQFFQGDLLQFSRYALFAREAGAKVTLAAPRAMHRLLQTLADDITLVDEDVIPADEDYDVISALMSLPAAFGTTLATVPQGRYLRADPDRVAKWRARIGQGGLKVGISWRGSDASLAGPIPRAFPLAAAAPLASVPGVRLISLQKGPGVEQLANLPFGMNVETLGPEFDSGPDLYLDTAAAIQACDLVVGMCGSVGHLAAALGAETWFALMSAPDWRWLERRTDTPWYPTARLYRQTMSNEWGGVFAAMARDLRTHGAI